MLISGRSEWWVISAVNDALLTCHAFTLSLIMPHIIGYLFLPTYKDERILKKLAPKSYISLMIL